MRAYGSGAAPEHVGAVGDGAATALGQPGENRIRRRYPFTNLITLDSKLYLV